MYGPDRGRVDTGAVHQIGGLVRQPDRNRSSLAGLDNGHLVIEDIARATDTRGKRPATDA